MTVSRTVTAAASALAVVALAGCTQLAQRRLDFDKTEDIKGTEIVVAPGSGDVVVRTAPVSTVQIKRVVRYRADEPGTTYRIEGSVLTVDTDCGRQCSVSYDITAPEGVTVRGENGSGDVTLTNVAGVDVTVGSGSITVNGASGSVRAQTGSGDVSVTDMRGPATLRADSGSVAGRELGGGDVAVTTGSGDITLTLDTARSVRARTGSGTVEVSVPAGSYRVRARTGSGDKDIRVVDDPASAVVLDLETGSGDIAVTQGL